MFAGCSVICAFIRPYGQKLSVKCRISLVVYVCLYAKNAHNLQVWKVGLSTTVVFQKSYTKIDMPKKIKIKYSR